MLTPSREPTTPGRYWFEDQPGNRQRVEVVLEAGELRARFEDMDEGDELPLVADMAGAWESAAS